MGEGKEVEPNFVSLDDKSSQTDSNINREELTIESLHSDLESKLSAQGFIFDKKKFIFEDKHLGFGERLADKVASFGGSWTFIIIFGVFIFIWISINGYWLMNQGYDPFPFILLNLILSCIASIQAPVIMMSQNRQALKDRKQEEINIEKEILDFKQDRLDLILDQKEWDLLLEMNDRLKRIEEKVFGKNTAVRVKKRRVVRKR
ncbi:DUF1003 domain-containing protein [Candidatus Woesearchaeota archaeon]|nr:DUF1003 domain-containing protein [Candidatus Woesearchaeota archaeon]